MNIIDVLNNHNAKLVCGDRWITAHVDHQGQCFTVYEQTKRMKHPRCLTATENLDDACRYLIKEKG